MPDKKKTSYYILKENDGVIIIPKDKDYVYMEEMYRPFINKKSLEFPGGIIDKNEKPVEAAEREIGEELGATIKKITFLGRYDVWVARTDMKVWVFLAENINFDKEKKKLYQTEKEFDIMVKKIKISDIRKLIKSKRIKSAHHIMAYYIFLDFMATKTYKES